MQSRQHSLVEATVNVAIGFVVALLTQMTLFPAIGLCVSLEGHLLIGTVFTLVALARSYLLRRLFERVSRSLG